ncbi:stalk domain-containing protein [Paenibacillus alginolyticus]|uniref:Stalk domain-containing protein n=1 Tax=Paenibacillus alginolyticus TaxID=59839 RepID=A0ABT4G9B3_9BACL|nr:stalk domain-containing protein [Paenibacillus alginolyticus]MCY9692776.1 stalk domain-containing protein [Paenibacillus alginolyticus]MEC0146097.1 stalk domain-containing protein [Paenibacillus alginolyticus]
MKKNPFNMLKLGVVGCAMLVGVSCAVLPFTSMASAEAVTVVPILAPAASESTSPVQVKEVNLTSKTQDLKTNIKVPQLSGMLDTKYQEQTNDLILSQANKDLTNWEKEAAQAAADAKTNGFTYRPYELTINYALKSDGSSNPAGVVSLEVTTYAATGGTGMPRVDTYNVLNSEQGQRVTLQDLLGDHFKENVNAGIQAKINEKPENYFKDEFKGISEEKGFYVEKGEVVIVFPKYSIAPGSTGTPEFRFNLPEKWTMTTKPVAPKPVEKMKLDLAGSDSLTNAEGVNLVPLRKVAEGLGYEVKWNQEKYAAELTKGAGWTNVSVGSDSYFYAKMAPVTLGTAPVILNDTLYVPLKFVTDILHADVETGDAGAIHIEQ